VNPQRLAADREPESRHDFPEGFQGAGPVFAAVPLGDPWYNLAVRGATTYVVEIPRQDPEHVDGWAFLDRGQAEAVADAVADGEFSRYQGLCGWYDCTPARAEAGRLVAAEATRGRGPSAGHAERLAEVQGPEAGS
jgi:hypothetical protein